MYNVKEREIPNNIDAEQSVLGAMFLSKYALEKGLESLDKNVFYLNAHNKIFEVLEELSERQVPIDILAVTEELEKKQYLNAIGGVEYLTEIINGVPSANNIDQYIKMLIVPFILKAISMNY